MIVSERRRVMIDRIKIGNFLRDLRKEKGVTQEELAEKFGVSSRSVSRWENGNTMPELGILVELADYYSVDIREIIDGERKSEIMEPENKETLLKVADYSSEEKKSSVKKIVIIFLVIILMILILYPLEHNYSDNVYALFAFSKEHVVEIDNDTYRCAKDRPEDFVIFMQDKNYELVDQLGRQYEFARNEECGKWFLTVKTFYCEWKRK